MYNYIWDKRRWKQPGQRNQYIKLKKQNYYVFPKTIQLKKFFLIFQPPKNKWSHLECLKQNNNCWCFCWLALGWQEKSSGLRYKTGTIPLIPYSHLIPLMPQVYRHSLFYLCYTRIIIHVFWYERLVDQLLNQSPLAPVDAIHLNIVQTVWTSSATYFTGLRKPLSHKVPENPAWRWIWTRDPPNQQTSAIVLP